jgi:nucleotidyltransferase/DNA polymerase involved in DNA repair
MRRDEKVIFHMDGDAFFVGVEVARNPKLKGLPVVTGQERGIVSALSYEAKALGVTRGLPIFQLKKKFPEVIILPGDYITYEEYSEKMFDIVGRYIDEVEEYSIDECFGDLTGLDKTLKMSFKEIAERIKKEINEELNLSVSLGIGPTKSLAKVASKWIKPNGLTLIDKYHIKDFLKEIPIGKVWGIGWQTSIFLEKRGIKTALDLALKNRSWVEENLAKPYKIIWQELNGLSVLDVDPNPKDIYSSIQKTRSFHPFTNDSIFLLSQFSKNIEESCAKARYYSLIPKRVSFFLKTRDFKYLTISMGVSPPTSAPEILMNILKNNFLKMYIKGVMYRTTGVVLHELVPENRRERDLFGSDIRAKKFEIIHKQIDSLEEKIGKRVIHLASTHRALKNKRFKQF